MAATARALMCRARALWNQGATVVQEQYVNTMKENMQYVVKDPEQEKILLRQFVFTKLSKIPAGYAHVQEELKALQEGMTKTKDFTVNQIGIYCIYCAELVGWFCVGEIIGRGGTLLGYKV